MLNEKKESEVEQSSSSSFDREEAFFDQKLAEIRDQLFTLTCSSETMKAWLKDGLLARQRKIDKLTLAVPKMRCRHCG